MIVLILAIIAFLIMLPPALALYTKWCDKWL